MFIAAAMGPPGGGRSVISKRLQSRFNLINMTFPTVSIHFSYLRLFEDKKYEKNITIGFLRFQWFFVVLLFKLLQKLHFRSFGSFFIVTLSSAQIYGFSDIDSSIV